MAAIRFAHQSIQENTHAIGNVEEKFCKQQKIHTLILFTKIPEANLCKVWIYVENFFRYKCLILRILNCVTEIISPLVSGRT